MWKMIAGGMVFALLMMYMAAWTPFYIAQPLLVVILVALLVVGWNRHKTRGIGIALVIFAASFILFSYYYKTIACGPDKKDVAVMKPMAEAISSYIVKNGIPKSLKDIPGLPYELEGCKREIKYPYLKKQKTKNKKL